LEHTSDERDKRAQVARISAMSGLDGKGRLAADARSDGTIAGGKRRPTGSGQIGHGSLEDSG